MSTAIRERLLHRHGRKLATTTAGVYAGPQAARPLLAEAAFARMPREAAGVTLRVAHRSAVDRAAMSKARTALDAGKRRVVLWVVGSLFVVLVLAGASFLVLVATSFSGTSVTKRDFADATEAAAFVSAHLPAPLPTGAEVEELTYDRFTDWHLLATVSLGSSEAVEAYLRTAREQRQENIEYCGPWHLPAEGVTFFLAKFHACGSIVPGPIEGSITVRCLTR